MVLPGQLGQLDRVVLLVFPEWTLVLTDLPVILDPQVPPVLLDLLELQAPRVLPALRVLQDLIYPDLRAQTVTPDLRVQINPDPRVTRVRMVLRDRRVLRA